MLMRTFVDIERSLAGQPPRVGALLGRVDVGKGREELYADQLPELLRSLAQRTRVESIRASTALEGVDVDEDRARRLANEPGARVRNRNEQEFAGYRDAIDELMRAAKPERVSVPFILHVHRRLYEHSGGRGGYLKTDDNLITTRDDDGRRVVIFEPPPWRETEFLIQELVARYNEACDQGRAHPLVLLGGFILDFLAIHPVADGNGRLARLLTTDELLRNGYGIARYVSVEQRIFESKNAYYTALEQSQRGWHDAQHDVWPWIEYLVTVLGDAYDTFEDRVAAARSTAGMTKQEIVRQYVTALPSGRQFRMRDLRAALPGISDQTFGIVLRELKSGEITVEGRGHGAVWIRQDSPSEDHP
jgi:Fic family protein